MTDPRRDVHKSGRGWPPRKKAPSYDVQNIAHLIQKCISKEQWNQGMAVFLHCFKVPRLFTASRWASSMCFQNKDLWKALLRINNTGGANKSTVAQAL